MLKHSGTVTIESDRLILRRCKIEDAEHMFNNWLTDSDVLKFAPFKTYNTVAEAFARVNYVLNKYHENHYYEWIIELKSTGDVIGTISATDVDDRIGCCEIGYLLGKAWWNQGYATEALAILLDFLFYTVGFQRITARHDAGNPASGRVMQKAGMMVEAVMCRSGWSNSGLGDYVCYVALDNSWRKPKYKIK